MIPKGGDRFSEKIMPEDMPLRILHVLRAPVGGLFRHVADLARAQAGRGHFVGVIADSTHTNDAVEARFGELADVCKLGVFRVPMGRHIGLADKNAIRHVTARAIESHAEILHGHGAKGGAYARLAKADALRVYTPHGGSLHYSRFSPAGMMYLRLERMLAKRTGLFLFESEYSLETFRRKIGQPRALARVVHNGVTPQELELTPPDRDASDVVFVGELRRLKGVDVLIEALANTARTATVAGDGPDAEAFRALAAKRGLASQIRFVGGMPARAAFRRGHVLVVPSRAESFPYIVLEAMAAGMPVIATKVGGIPEIFGSDADQLIPPGNAPALAGAIDDALKKPPRERTARLRDRVALTFTVSAMADGVLKAYAEALSKRVSGNR